MEIITDQDTQIPICQKHQVEIYQLCIDQNCNVKDKMGCGQCFDENQIHEGCDFRSFKNVLLKMKKQIQQSEYADYAKKINGQLEDLIHSIETKQQEIIKNLQNVCQTSVYNLKRLIINGHQLDHIQELQNQFLEQNSEQLLRKIEKLYEKNNNFEKLLQKKPKKQSIDDYFKKSELVTKINELSQIINEKFQDTNQNIECVKTFLQRRFQEQLEQQPTFILQDQLLQQKFNLSDFKQYFMSEDDKVKGVQEFFKQCDFNEYSIWSICFDEIDDHETTLSYWTSFFRNILLNNIKSLKEQGFGTMGVYENEDYNKPMQYSGNRYEICGVFIWKGQNIPDYQQSRLKLDLSKSKLDHTDEKHKQLLCNSWAGKVDQTIQFKRILRDIEYFI